MSGRDTPPYRHSATNNTRAANAQSTRKRNTHESGIEAAGKGNSPVRKRQQRRIPVDHFQAEDEHPAAQEPLGGRQARKATVAGSSGTLSAGIETPKTSSRSRTPVEGVRFDEALNANTDLLQNLPDKEPVTAAGARVYRPVPAANKDRQGDSPARNVCT